MPRFGHTRRLFVRILSSNLDHSGAHAKAHNLGLTAFAADLARR